jgi:hypothetical protein
MSTKLALAALAAGLLAAFAPGAHAAPWLNDCQLVSVTSDLGATGGTDGHTGVLAGYATFDDVGLHTLRCYVSVNGSEAASTSPVGGNTVVLATATVVTFTATEEADLVVCTELDNVTVTCKAVTDGRVPPKAVGDLLDSVGSKCGAVVNTSLNVTGIPGAYNGVVYGYAAFGDQAPHTLDCYVTVDGTEAGGSIPMSGTDVVATAGPVTLSAQAGDTVALCVRIDGVTKSCSPVSLV